MSFIQLNLLTEVTLDYWAFNEVLSFMLLVLLSSTGRLNQLLEERKKTHADSEYECNFKDYLA